MLTYRFSFLFRASKFLIWRQYVVIKKNIIEDVSVLVPVKFAGALTYKVAKDQDLSAGDFVLVPLGRREVIGVVWDSKVEYFEADKKKYNKEKI